LTAFRRGDGIVVGDRFVAFRRSSCGGRCADLGDDLVGRAVVVTGTVGVNAGVVDDDLRAFFGHEDGDTAADAAAGACDDGYLIGQGVHGLPPGREMRNGKGEMRGRMAMPRAAPVMTATLLERVFMRASVASFAPPDVPGGLTLETAVL